MTTAKEPTEKHKCEALLSSGPGTFRRFPCGRPAAYEHDGAHYRKTHHPPNREAKSMARQAKWSVEFDAALAKSKAADDELAAMRKHARLYLWLRDIGSRTWSPLTHQWLCTGAECDASIEAEIAKTPISEKVQP